jgi:hypothetical protein
MLTVLLEPVTVSGILAGKLFHAQLKEDMTLPAGMNRRDDAIELKRGTDVYLKVKDTNQQIFGGHMGEMAVDHVVFNGQQVALNTPAWPVQFAVPPPHPRRNAVPTVDVIMPAGYTTGWWDIAQEVEVSTAGMSADQVKRKVPPPDPSEQAQYGDEALRRAIADYNTTWINHGMIAKGTVSSVGQRGAWELLHFQEADDNFVVCFPASTFRGLPGSISNTGADDFSGLIGKTVEIRGRVSALNCAPNSVGMEISVPAQIQVFGVPTNNAAPKGKASAIGDTRSVAPPRP